MNYISIDHPEHFVFMDTSWELVRWEGRELTFRVRDLCVSEDEPNNPEDCDLQTESALVTFRDFELLRAETAECRSEDADGNIQSVTPAKYFEGEAGMELLTEDALFVINFDPVGDHWVIQAEGTECFQAHLRFSSIQIEWDGFSRAAWYEVHEYFECDALLAAPEGEKQVKLTLETFHEDPIDPAHNPIEAPRVIARLRCGGKDYIGRGEDDYLWIDAIADLQRNLPEGVTLKCCLSCRHGNLCPTGNEPDELFCTKDVAISQKSDLFFYTEDPAERSKRSRKYFHCCGDWQEQSEDYYTYNDYLYDRSWES